MSSLQQEDSSSHQWQATLVTFGACALVVAMIARMVHYHGFWERRGVRGPRPRPIVGNVVDMIYRNRYKIQEEWRRKYGKVYGVYFGSNPKLVISDPESIIQVSVKDFDVFPNHSNEPNFMNKYMRNFIFNQVDDQWKRVRCLQSQTFTSGKIKRMFKLLDVCSDDLIKLFNEQLEGDKGKKETIINVKELYDLYTLDGITSCCYTLKLNRAGSSNLRTAASRDKVAEVATKMFRVNSLRFLTTMIAPKPILDALNFHMLSTRNQQPMADLMTSIIKKRSQLDGAKYNDYLQMLLEARIDGSLKMDENDQHENHHVNQTNEGFQEEQKKFVAEVGAKAILSDMEILSSAMFIATVGLETTSTLLSTCTYILSFHPEIQDQLYDELMKIGQRNETGEISFDYESITGCRYLDSVLSESLRITPPVTNIERQAKRDYRLEKYGIDIPKETKLELAIQVVQNDPDYWDEPHKFKPERFMPGNKDKIVPGSYCPFGLGPRHCLGMRFSLTEAKLGLAKIVTNFRFKPAPGATFPPEPKPPMAFFRLKTPNIILMPRK